jgi:hypothetical protein
MEQFGRRKLSIAAFCKELSMASMRLRRRILLYITGLAFLLLSTGCGGLSGSYSVSPASFFLPGLLKIDKPAMGPTNTMEMARL